MIYMLKSEQTKDDWELYLLDIESQVHSRLTSHPGWDGYAVWSPDGTKIVYDREDEPGKRKRPWILDFAGQTSKPLGSYEGWLSISDWSDDNRLLGFHELEGQRDLVLLDSKGAIIEKITTTDDHSEHDAHFSPDGKQIAYANGTLDGSETTLELIDPENGTKTVLRSSIGRIYGISWSPDGRQIAFVDAPEGDEDDADIFIYHTADQSFKQVTNDPAWDHMPAFCNNPHTLLFTSYRSGEERIYQVDPDPRPFLKIESN
jgi:Tol biopolymer transport system component